MITEAFLHGLVLSQCLNHAGREIIRELNPIVDHWKVGKINRNKEIEKRQDWLAFREEAKELLINLEANYYLKKSLTAL